MKTETGENNIITISIVLASIGVLLTTFGSYIYSKSNDY